MQHLPYLPGDEYFDGGCLHACRQGGFARSLCGGGLLLSNSPEDTSYLKPGLILAIAKKTGAAIHPGYGFLSENADFARRCEEEGVIFIGPGADIIAKMGIKTEARKIMREAGLPSFPERKLPCRGSKK